MPTETQAWVVEKEGGPFVLHDVTLDDPLEDEVLVQMISTGLCHTDFTSAKGLLPGSVFPQIFGHEGAGKVLSVGSSVANVQPGDSVLLSFASCGACGPCDTAGRYACDSWGMLNFGRVRSDGTGFVGSLKDGRKVNGSYFGQSSFAKHALVRGSSCVKVDPSLDIAMLAPLGCGMQTGAGAVLNVAKPSPDSTLLISGMGGVGMAALFAAVSLGVKTIIAVDTIDQRLELAKSFGATHAINAKTSSTVEEVMKITSGKGVNYAIEATGVPPAAKAAFTALAMRGVMVQVGDSGIGELSIPLSQFLQGLRSIVGCVEGNGSPQKLVPLLAKMYSEGKFPLDKISRKYSWRDMDKAKHDMHTGAVIKAILVFDD